MVNLRLIAGTAATLCFLAAFVDAKDEPTLPLEGHTEVLSFNTSEGSWLSIDVTPEGDTLVFDLLGDLYSLPIEGGQACLLYTSPSPRD